MQLKVKKLYPDARLPVYATDGSGAFDLFAYTVNGAYTLGSLCYDGHPVTVDTGLEFEVPPGFMLVVNSRSGHGFKYGVRLANAAGWIDPDYRGPLMVKLVCDDANEDAPALIISPGDRIAQAALVPMPRVEFVEVDELSDTARGAGGLGSTGK